MDKKELLTLGSFSKISWLEHGFSTQSLGDFNLTNFERGGEGYQKLSRITKTSLSNFVLMAQVHGSKVELVSWKDKGRVIEAVDGLVTKDSEVYLSVRSADCLPILFVDPMRKIVGAAHAGWKGTLEGVGQGVVALMKDLGSETKNILVGFGPSIGPCHYEIKEDVADLFRKAFDRGWQIINEKDKKTFLDLRQANLCLLQEAGISLSNIKIVDLCTYCDESEFYSSRRKDLSARQLSFIGVRNA
jgi:YfiH family protein